MSFGTIIGEVIHKFSVSGKLFVDYFFEMIAELAKERSDCFFIISRGNVPELADSSEMDNVSVHSKIAQVSLLALCDLMITHGGLASVTEATKLGLPMVVVPICLDQHAIADVVEKLQLGVAFQHSKKTRFEVRPIFSGHYSSGGLTKEALADAIDRMLAPAQVSKSQNFAKDLSDGERFEDRISKLFQLARARRTQGAFPDK